MKIKHTLSLITILLLAGIALFFFGRSLWIPVTQQLTGKRTVTEAVAEYGERARNQLKPYFIKAGISYPPKAITILAMKEEKQLELWVTNSNEENTYIRTYQIKKLSGNAGPKLKEGDRQVPEGIYKITGLNPNSSYHLSMKLNYPNDFDLKYAKIEGRVNPGTNIFIHGKSVSIGCLAMGDKAIEELFVLSKDTGIKNISVIISPYDPRVKKLTIKEEIKENWVEDMYLEIEKMYANYPKT